MIFLINQTLESRLLILTFKLYVNSINKSINLKEQGIIKESRHPLR